MSGIVYKTPDQIERIRQSSLLVGKTLAEVAKWIEPGITPLKLDNIAEQFIRDNGGTPVFLGYGGFPNSLCVSVNSVVVHGIPGDVPLQNGDIVSVDCGVLLNGYVGDSAYTFEVGQVSDDVRKLVRTTRECLYKGIDAARAGNRVGDIGFAVQSLAELNGYGVVRELVGHGVGKSLHEPPEIPNYGRPGKGKVLSAGMTIAIEPMINMGTREVTQEKDGWTIRTRDRKPSAHFEHTLAITENGPDILSSHEEVEKILEQKFKYV